MQNVARYFANPKNAKTNTCKGIFTNLHPPTFPLPPPHTPLQFYSSVDKSLPILIEEIFKCNQIQKDQKEFLSKTLRFFLFFSFVKHARYNIHKAMKTGYRKPIFKNYF